MPGIVTKLAEDGFAFVCVCVCVCISHFRTRLGYKNIYFVFTNNGVATVMIGLRQGNGSLVLKNVADAILVVSVLVRVFSQCSVCVV